MLVCKYPNGGTFPINSDLDAQQCRKEEGMVVDDGTGKGCTGSVAPGTQPELGGAGLLLALFVAQVLRRVPVWRAEKKTRRE